MKIKDQLMESILLRCKPKVIHQMYTAIDLAMRWKLNQMNSVERDKEMIGIIDGIANPVVGTDLYEAIEIAEYLKCYQLYKVCPIAKDCWITRRGFGNCYYIDGGKNENNHRNKR